MSFARDVYTAVAAQTDFTITFSYLEEVNVVVTKDGVTQTQGASADYIFANATTIRFNTGLVGGEIIVLTRSTSQSTRLTDYTAGALTEADLDNDSLQGFFMAQEAIDEANISLGLDTTENWDGEAKRIKNVADPIADQDAATKVYADTTVSAAAASATAAAASETAAATSEANAATSETNAESANTAAQSTLDRAQITQFLAGSAQRSKKSATASAAAAATSEANAATSESNAATSETNAATSETNAASSASAAATSATNASTSETNAAASAAAASTSETNAAASETNASASEVAAEAAADRSQFATGASHIAVDQARKARVSAAEAAVSAATISEFGLVMASRVFN